MSSETLWRFTYHLAGVSFATAGCESLLDALSASYAVTIDVLHLLSELFQHFDRFEHVQLNDDEGWLE